MGDQTAVMTANAHTTLVLGGTGRIGGRVARRLTERGLDVRIGSRTGEPAFDWEDTSTWAAAVKGVRSAYLTFYPEVEWPGADEAIGAFARLAVDSGVERLVLLSGRKPGGSVPCEDGVTALPVEWTIVAPASFHQNFNEGVFVEPLRHGLLALPAGDSPEPFVDADDIADVAVAALTESGHAGQRYELTGPRSWTLAEGVAEIARATGRDLRYMRITEGQFADAVVEEGAPREFADTLAGLLSGYLNAPHGAPTDDVERVLNRKPRDFADWVAEIAPTGVWDAAG